MVFGQNRVLGRNEETVEFSSFLTLKTEKGQKMNKIAKIYFSQQEPLQSPKGRKPRFFSVKMSPPGVARARQRPAPGPARSTQNEAKSYPPLGNFGQFLEKRQKGKNQALEDPKEDNGALLERAGPAFESLELVLAPAEGKVEIGSPRLAVFLEFLDVFESQGKGPPTLGPDVLSPGGREKGRGKPLLD